MIKKFDKWEVEVDPEENRKLYLSTPVKNTCVCDYCANFYQALKSFPPQNTKDIFNKLGLEVSKPDSISWINEHYYDLKFYLYGKIKQSDMPAKLDDHTFIYFEEGLRGPSSVKDQYLQKDKPLLTLNISFSNFPWVLSK